MGPALFLLHQEGPLFSSSAQNFWFFRFNARWSHWLVFRAAWSKPDYFFQILFLFNCAYWYKLNVSLSYTVCVPHAVAAHLGMLSCSGIKAEGWGHCVLPRMSHSGEALESRIILQLVQLLHSDPWKFLCSILDKIVCHVLSLPHLMTVLSKLFFIHGEKMYVPLYLWRMEFMSNILILGTQHLAK